MKLYVRVVLADTKLERKRPAVAVAGLPKRIRSPDEASPKNEKPPRISRAASFVVRAGACAPARVRCYWIAV